MTFINPTEPCCGAGAVTPDDPQARVPVVMCDVQADGSSVQFVRWYTYDPAADTTSHVDLGLDASVYAVTGTPGQCPEDPTVDLWCGPGAGYFTGDTFLVIPNGDVLNADLFGPFGERVSFRRQGGTLANAASNLFEMQAPGDSVDMVLEEAANATSWHILVSGNLGDVITVDIEPDDIGAGLVADGTGGRHRFTATGASWFEFPVSVTSVAVIATVVTNTPPTAGARPSVIGMALDGNGPDVVVERTEANNVVGWRDAVTLDEVTDQTILDRLQPCCIDDDEPFPELPPSCWKSREDEVEFVADFLNLVNPPAEGSTAALTIPMTGPLPGIFATITPINGANWSSSFSSAGIIRAGFGFGLNTGLEIDFDIPGPCEGLEGLVQTRLNFWDLDGVPATVERVRFNAPPDSWSANLNPVAGSGGLEFDGTGNAQTQWVIWDQLLEHIEIDHIPSGLGGNPGAIVMNDIQVTSGALTAVYQRYERLDGRVEFVDLQGTRLIDENVISRLRPCGETQCDDGAGGGNVVGNTPVVTRYDDLTTPTTTLHNNELVAYTVRNIDSPNATFSVNGAGAIPLAVGEVISVAAPDGELLQDTIFIDPGTGTVRLIGTWRV